MLNTAMFLAPLFRDAPRISNGTLRRATRAFKVPFRQRLSIASIAPRSFRGYFTPDAFAICHFMEQPARWDSFVTLGHPKTVAKVAEPIYRWRCGEEERRTMTENCRYLAEALLSANLGSVYTDGEDYKVDDVDLERNSHPMGGTIMGTDAKTSVVDSDLCVHGLRNLFVCGGSVIPRSGAAMVTGVIVQLAVRLADHLKAAHIGDRPSVAGIGGRPNIGALTAAAASPATDADAGAAGVRK